MAHPLPHPPLAQIHYNMEYLDKSFTFCLDLILLLLSFIYLYLFPKSLFCILCFSQIKWILKWHSIEVRTLTAGDLNVRKTDTSSCLRVLTF